MTAQQHGNSFEFWCFQSDLAEDSIRLGYGAESLGNKTEKFQGNSALIFIGKRCGQKDLKIRTQVHWNLGLWLASNVASYPKRGEISWTLSISIPKI